MPQELIFLSAGTDASCGRCYKGAAAVLAATGTRSQFRFARVSVTVNETETVTRSAGQEATRGRGAYAQHIPKYSLSHHSGSKLSLKPALL